MVGVVVYVLASPAGPSSVGRADAAMSVAARVTGTLGALRGTPTPSSARRLGIGGAVVSTAPARTAWAPSPTVSPMAPVVVATDAPATPYVDGELQAFKYSWYWPPLGGINCDGDCSRLADGSSWSDRLSRGERVVACPAEYPLGTGFEWPVGTGLVWVCRDRGHGVVRDGSVIWLDFLQESGAVSYGTWGVVRVLR